MDIFAPHAADFYKTGHVRMYPDKSELVYSNFTCRSDKLGPVLPDFDHKVVFFGLQGLARWMLIDLWNRTFFERPRDEVVARYKRRMDRALGAGAVDPSHMAALHDLGYLPLLIKALPEGSRVDIRVPTVTIRNTKPEFFWLTNYIETQLSAELWKPITSATSAYEFRRLLERYATMTGADPAAIDWQGHDFSMRGMSGLQDAVSNGAAHLLSFRGTDTIASIDYLEEYYENAPEHAGEMIGASVPATEHSVMCMGGETDEIETFRRLINVLYPTGIVSIVSDTWDFWRVVTEFMVTLKDEILARQPDALGNAKVVLRPDSGDPVKILVGDEDAEPGTPEHKGAVECLWDIFGGSTTAKGYRVLNPRIGLIYGDSINLDRATRIMASLEAKGFASTNVVLGIGSFTYQYVTRDSYGTAVKATYGVVDGKGRILSKTPKTDSGTKNSAHGLLRIEQENGHFVLHETQTEAEEQRGLLQPVFHDGRMVRHETLHDIRARLAHP